MHVFTIFIYLFLFLGISCYYHTLSGHTSFAFHSVPKTVSLETSILQTSHNICICTYRRMSQRVYVLYSVHTLLISHGQTHIVTGSTYEIRIFSKVNWNRFLGHMCQTLTSSTELQINKWCSQLWDTRASPTSLTPSPTSPTTDQPNKVSNAASGIGAWSATANCCWWRWCCCFCWA